MEEQASAHQLYIEHKTRADIVITKCLEYVEQNKHQPKQVQKHWMTFSIIVHTTPNKVKKIPAMYSNPST